MRIPRSHLRENLALVSITYSAFAAGYVIRWLALCADIRRTAHFRRVFGEVVSSRVVARSDRRGVRHRVQIEFAYTVDGRRFRNDGWEFESGESIDPAAARRECERFPPGRAVAIRYDPERPMRSMLDERRVAAPLRRVVAVGAFGLVALVVAIVIALAPPF